MAEKRMFTKKITESDAFLDLPLSAQALYFHLNMNADDDGFVNNPKMIARIIGAKNDDLNLLEGKRFVLPFPSGVIVVKHWKMHNTIQADRYKPTSYVDEMSKLSVKDNKSYTWKQFGNNLETDWKQNGNTLETQYRLDKNSLDKNSIDKNTFAPTSNDIDAMEKEIFAELPLLNNQFYKIYTDDVSHYKEQFPAIDVEQELRNAIAWTDANPKNRKKQGKRFLTNWLLRKQERARAYSTPQKGDSIFYDTSGTE